MQPLIVTGLDLDTPDGALDEFAKLEPGELARTLQTNLSPDEPLALKDLFDEEDRNQRGKSAARWLHLFALGFVVFTWIPALGAFRP